MAGAATAAAAAPRPAACRNSRRFIGVPLVDAGSPLEGVPPEILKFAPSRRPTARSYASVRKGKDETLAIARSPFARRGAGLFFFGQLLKHLQCLQNGFAPHLGAADVAIFAVARDHASAAGRSTKIH